VDFIPFDFIRNNLLLVAVAVVSGTMLVWPYLRRTTGGPWASAAQATMLINREDALVVDVREPNEYSAGHILGARNVPLGEIEARSASGELAKRKEKPVIVYCDSGDRANKALALLRKAGFARVVNLSGGLPSWQQAGLPVEK
jgi:rhodanese-related sulfurtransferase